MSDTTIAERRAARLVHWYPSSWRDRYGEEFIELLLSDIEERPRSTVRAINVALSGSLVRLQGAGLMGDALDPGTQARASLAMLGLALSAFLLFGVGIWAQIAIGWQWSVPDNRPTVLAMIAMSLAVATFAALGLLAATPIAWSVVRGLVRTGRSGLRGPTVLFFASTTVLVVGGRHFGNGWPGTGGHPWSHQGLVPGGVAAFGWASTLSVTSYWAHPSALLHFPSAEVVWMVTSPLAVAGMAVASAKTIRRVELSERVLRFESAIARCACVVMVVFLTGGLGWVVDGGPGPRNLFHAGAVDYVGLGVMAAALALGFAAASRAPRRRRVAPAAS